MSYQALTRPSGIGRVLDSGFRLFSASFRPVLGLVVFAALANIIMQYSMAQAMMPTSHFTSQDEMLVYMADLWPQMMVLNIIILLVNLIIYNAILSHIGCIARSDSDELYDSLTTGLKKALPVFFAAILYALAVAIGFVLLVIPGFILMISLILFQIMIVIEDKGIIDSLKASHNLVWGNYWRTSVVILVPFFVIYALILAVFFLAGLMGAPVGIETIENGIQMHFGVFDIVVIVLSVLMLPLMDSIMIAQVNDLKLRKTGSDLEARISA